MENMESVVSVPITSYASILVDLSDSDQRTAISRMLFLYYDDYAREFGSNDVKTLDCLKRWRSFDDLCNSFSAPKVIRGALDPDSPEDCFDFDDGIDGDSWFPED